MKSKCNNIVILVNDIRSSFVMNELNFYETFFTNIYIVSNEELKGQENFSRKFKFINLNIGDYKTIDSIIPNLFDVLKSLFIEIIDSKTNIHYLLKLKYLTSYYLRALYLSNKLGKIIGLYKFDIEKTVFISYWFDQTALILSLLVKKKIINEYYSRAHGIDVFEFRAKRTKRLPFRNMQLKYIKFAFSVSDKGKFYIEKRYPKFASKVKKAYLGTYDKGFGKYNPNDKFTILSCATVRDLKRIYLIPQILEEINFPIRWIHIGNDDMTPFDTTKDLYFKGKDKILNNPNVECLFLGELDNEIALRLYKTNTIHLFISLSETEGLPVSMMEAISFGVPIIGTDVGGCSEIVNNNTGFLIPKHFIQDDVINIIKKVNKDKLFARVARKRTREFWLANFEIEKNLTEFYETL